MKWPSAAGDEYLLRDPFPTIRQLVTHSRMAEIKIEPTNGESDISMESIDWDASPDPPELEAAGSDESPRFVDPDSVVLKVACDASDSDDEDAMIFARLFPRPVVHNLRVCAVDGIHIPYPHVHPTPLGASETVNGGGSFGVIVEHSDHCTTGHTTRTDSAGLRDLMHTVLARHRTGPPGESTTSSPSTQAQQPGGAQ